MAIEPIVVCVHAFDAEQNYTDVTGEEAGYCVYVRTPPPADGEAFGCLDMLDTDSPEEAAREADRLRRVHGASEIRWY